MCFSVSQNKKIDFSCNLSVCSVCLVVSVGLCVLTSLTLYSKLNPYDSSLSKLGRACVLNKRWTVIMTGMTASATLIFAVSLGRLVIEYRKQFLSFQNEGFKPPKNEIEKKAELDKTSISQEISLKSNHIHDSTEVESLKLSDELKNKIRKFAKTINRSWNTAPNRLVRLDNRCHGIADTGWSFPSDFIGINWDYTRPGIESVSDPFNLLWAISDVAQELPTHNERQKISVELVLNLFNKSIEDAFHLEVKNELSKIDRALETLDEKQKQLQKVKDFVSCLKIIDYSDFTLIVEQVKELAEERKNEFQKLLLGLGVILNTDGSLFVTKDPAPTGFGFVVLAHLEPSLEIRELFIGELSKESSVFSLADVHQKSFKKGLDSLKEWLQKVLPS